MIAHHNLLCAAACLAGLVMDPAALAADAASQVATPEPQTRSATNFSASRPEWEPMLRNADADLGRQLADAGRPDQGIIACMTCHGQQGIAPAGGNFPNLAGLRPEYIAKQLVDYRTDERTAAPIMAPIAKALTDADIGALAVYYGGLAGPPVAAPPDPAESAYKLNVLGDNERALPACVNCHGMTGRGASPLIPRLTGQPKDYFIEQMNHFRTDERHNDDMGVMRAFAKRLTPEEIEALGDYYAAARPTP